MEIGRINNLENLELHLEHDSGYVGTNAEANLARAYGNHKLIFNGSEDFQAEGCSYIKVDTTYSLNLSPGQQKLYEILVAFETASLHTVTTIGKLAEAMGIGVAPTVHRLDNLQTLKAIKGLVFYK